MPQKILQRSLLGIPRSSFLEPNDRVIPRFKCHGHKAKIKTRYPIRVHFYRRLVSVKVWAAAATYLWFFRYGNT